ncbi:MAG: flagellar motor switch protein FliG [Deltaproteobacteria bacterium]|nr:flagellar motor switch protein FliG [Deltaproteobacteria bacterium]MBZ0219296.1 flagellar motor switch protein FliG [Deltaproteobacteria bacterium]
MAKEPRLTGPEKAAVLLMNIGEELASEVFKFMTPSEMQLLGGMMVRKESVSLQMGRHVVGEFIEILDKGELFVEGIEFTRNVLVKTLGPERAQYILDQITREMGGGGIESLKWMDPAIVANIIKDEHPQIIALILAHLDADRAAMVLLNIQNERLRGEVMLRVGNLKRIPQAAVRDLEALISEQMLSAESSQGASVEGVKLAAEILNQVDSKAEGEIIDAIEKASPDLAMRIQEKMFVFSDLMEVDDRGLQLIIKELSGDVLCLALKAADEAIRDKFLGNMSERASEMLIEDMEAKGPVKLSEVEKSQQEIIKIARRLEQEGKLVRSGRSGDVLI